jgi:hypothetical protein
MSDKNKTILFMLFFIPAFLGPLGYLANDAYEDNKRISALYQQVQTIAENGTSESGMGRLLTGRLSASDGETLQSLETQSPCIASSARVTLETGYDAENSEVLTHEFPLARNQAKSLELVCDDGTFAIDIEQFDLSLWERTSKPNGTFNYLEASLPDYLGTDGSRGDQLKYVVDEYLLAQDQEVTVLAEVGSDGRLSSGEIPLTILPGSRAKFVKAVKSTSQEFSAESREGIIVLIAVTIFLGVFVLILFLCHIATKQAKKKGTSAEAARLPGWATGLILVLVLGVMGMFALLPGYLYSL